MTATSGSATEARRIDAEDWRRFERYLGEILHALGRSLRTCPATSSH